jgi:lycopene elongase/hydratase (dihydrobisanhydrobacterioruberin-forming)
VLRLGRIRKCRRLWRDLAVIHRLEYPLPITYLCYAAWGACYAAGEASRLLDPAVLVAIMANALMILGGLALNTAVDVRTDEQHQDKRYLARAVQRFGRGRALRLCAAELAAGLILAGAVSVATGRWAVVGAAVAAATLHLLYNVEPGRLKRRGLLGSAAIGASVVGMPFLLSYNAVRPDVEATAWPILAGLTVLAFGRTAWWSVPDLAADTATGLATPTVRHGAAATLTLSCLTLLAGLVVLGWGLWWRYGAAWLVVGIAAHGAFLAGALALRRRATGRAAPSAVHMRSRAMPVVALGELVLALIPFAAAG